MYGCQNSSSGTLTVTGNVSSSGTFGTAYALYFTGSGITNITGNCTAAGGAPALYNNGGGTINIITGNVTGGSTTAAIGAVNVTTGTISINGNVTAGTAGVGANNASTGPFTIVGDITATNGANGFTSSNTSATNRLAGSFINSANGTSAIYAAKYILNSTPLLAKTRYAKDGISQYVDMYTADNNPTGGVATTDVRSGVSYGGGLVGTCAVPNAGTVAFGVAVGNTTGTATLTAANLRAALGLASANMDTQLAVLTNLDATVSSRLAPSGTLATVTTLTNAPTVPTPAQIATQVRTELATELARVDAATSTRLASSAYTAPSNSDITAIKAKTDNLPSDPADQSLVVAAITAIPTVAQIRTELDSNSTKLANLDTTVSSRLASSVSTNITAIKAKTDLLNTDRLAQCATTSIVGSLIAQSNS